MSERFFAWSGANRRHGRSLQLLALLPLLLALGCGTVALSVTKPAGARVDLYEKGKWFGACGPDWGTAWHKVYEGTVDADNPCELELDACNSWLESVTTLFPPKYRASFDLSGLAVYPGTPSSMIEVTYVTEAIPPKYQDIVRYWQSGRTLDVLTHVPVEVLADILWNLGSKFDSLLRELPQARVEQATKDFEALGQAPSPAAVESWLKSTFSKEQLDQLLRWVRHGVTLTDVRWVPLGGAGKQPGVPALWRLLKATIELVVRQPDIRSTHVNFYRDVILRGLLTAKNQRQLVNTGALKLYADLVTYDTSYYSSRVVPAIDLIQDQALVVDLALPTPEEEAQLQKDGVTRSVPADQAARAEIIRNGLPPVSLKVAKVTSVRSQILGAWLENEMAYVVVWASPRQTDPARFLTTVVTTTPYGMARIWAFQGKNEVYAATAPFDETRAPLTSLAGWILSVIDRRDLVVDLDKPLAVMAFGGRRIAPWSDMPKTPVSRVKAVQDLEGAKPAGK